MNFQPGTAVNRRAILTRKAASLRPNWVIPSNASPTRERLAKHAVPES